MTRTGASAEADRPVAVGGRLAAPALAWLGGIALQLQERALQPVAVYGALMACGLLAALIAWRWRRAFVLAVLGAALLGFGVAGGRATLRLAQALPTALEGRDVVVTGVVASLPQPAPSGIRFRFRVEQAQLAGAPVDVPSMLALGWYRGWHEDAAAVQPQAELRAGQRWRFTVRLRKPHGSVNPHGFDYELTLFEQGLRATGYVRDAPAQRLDDAAGHPIERLRQAVRDAIDAHVSDRHAAGVLAALAIGDQAAIEWRLRINNCAKKMAKLLIHKDVEFRLPSHTLIASAPA